MIAESCAGGETAGIGVRSRAGHPCLVRSRSAGCWCTLILLSAAGGGSPGCNAAAQLSSLIGEPGGVSGSLPETPLSCHACRRERVSAYARTSPCERALGVQGCCAGAVGMLLGNTFPGTPLEHRTSKLLPFPDQLWCSRGCSHGRSGDVCRSRPGPCWASQRFLIRSAQPAAKIHVILQHPGGRTKPWPGSVTQGRELVLGPGLAAALGSDSAGRRQLLP